MVKSPGEKLIHVRATQPVSVEKMQNGKYVSIGDLKKGIMATNEKSGIRQFNEKNLDFDVSNPNTGNILGNIKNQNFVMSDHTTDFNPGDYNGEKGPLLNVRGFGNGQYSLESSVYKNQKFELSNVPEDGIFIANINGKDSKIIENRKGNIKIKHDNQGTKINGKNLGELSDKKVDKLRKKGFAGLSETRVDEKTSAIKWDSEEGAMEISPLNGEEVDKQKNEIVKDKKEETTKEDTDTEDKEGTEEEKKDKEKTQQTEKADEEELEKKEPKKSKLEVKSEGKAKEKQGSYRQIEKVEEDKKNKLKDYLDKNLPSASNKENAIYEEGTSLVIGGKRFDVYDGYVNRKFEQDNREIMTMSDGTSLIYDKNKGEVYYSDKEGNWYKVQVEKGKTITKNWL